MNVEYAYGFYYATEYKIFKKKGLFVLQNPISGHHLCSDNPEFAEYRTPSLLDLNGDAVIYDHRDKIFYCQCLIREKHPEATKDNIILKYKENNYNRCLLRQLTNSVKTVYERVWDFQSPNVLSLNPNGHCWFILDHQTPIGYASITIYGKDAHFYSIYILPPFHRKGFGTRSIKQIIDYILEESLANKVLIIDPTIITMNILIKLGYAVKNGGDFKFVNNKLCFSGICKGILPAPSIKDKILKNPLGWEKKHFDDLEL